MTMRLKAKRRGSIVHSEYDDNLGVIQTRFRGMLPALMAKFSKPGHSYPTSQGKQSADRAPEQERPRRANERGHEAHFSGTDGVRSLRKHIEDGKSSAAHVIGREKMKARLTHDRLKRIGQAHCGEQHEG